MDEIPVGGIVPYDPHSRWIKKGPNVPLETMNLAYVDTPELSPRDYIQIIDESGGNPANIYDDGSRRKVMWSGLDGCLEDSDGDQLIEDEYPTITDHFYHNDINSENILAYVHRSRFYHKDAPSLAPLNEVIGETSSVYYGRRIALTSEGGTEYPGKYSIHLAKLGDIPGSDRSYYRVLVYMDDVPDIPYYLSYSKLHDDLVTENIHWREIIAPQPVFFRSYDLNEVMASENDGKDLYYLETSGVSTPAGAIMGEGSRAFVTKKAIPDPRRYQFFQWRIRGDYTIEIDREKNMSMGDNAIINVGYLVYGKRTSPVNDSLFESDSQHPDHFCFYNLGLWGGNPGVSFVNPFPGGSSNKKERNYWITNLDSLSESKITQYDLLVFSTHIVDRSVNSLQSGNHKRLIDAFLAAGGVLLIEECGGGRIKWGEVSSSSPVLYKEGCWTTEDRSESPIPMGVYTDEGVIDNNISVLYSGDDIVGKILDARTWGGYEITEQEAKGIGDKFHHYWTELFTTGVGQDNTRRGCISYLKANKWDGWTKLVGDTENKPTIAARRSGDAGFVIMSTMDILCGCNDIWAEYDSTPGKEKHLHWLNCGSSVEEGANVEDDLHPLRDNVGGYLSLFGAVSFQILYNICLLACANRKSSQEGVDSRLTTKAVIYTPWKPSWVINGDVLLERPEPNEKLRYCFFPYSDEVVEEERRKERESKGETPEGEVFESVLARAIAATEWGPDGVPLSPTIGQLINSELPRAILSNKNRWEVTYTIEITNDRVKTPLSKNLNSDSIPVAWTPAPSPAFIHPPEYRVKSVEMMSAAEGFRATYKSIQDVTRAFRYRLVCSVQDPDELPVYEWVTVGNADTYYVDENVTHRVKNIVFNTLNSNSHRYGFKYTGQIAHAKHNDKNSNVVRYAQDALNHMIWLKENPWTPPEEHTYCPVTGDFDDTTKGFIAKWEEDRFKEGTPKTSGTLIDAAFFESIIDNLVVTNEYGVHVCGAGNHFYGNPDGCEDERTEAHGQYEDYRQNIPAVSAGAHGGHQFETIFLGYHNPFNLVDENPYTVFGTRSNIGFNASAYYDSVVIEFTRPTLVRKIKFTPHLPSGGTVYVTRVDVLHPGGDNENTIKSTPYDAKGGLGVAMSVDGEVCEVDLGGSAPTFVGPGIPSNPAHHAVSIEIHFAVRSPIPGTNCFYLAFKTIEIWGPRTAQQNIRVEDSGSIRLYDGQSKEIIPHPKYQEEDLYNYRAVTWEEVNAPPEGYISEIKSNKLKISTQKAQTNWLIIKPSRDSWYSGQVAASDGVKIMLVDEEDDERRVPVPLPPLPVEELLENGEDEGNRVVFWIEVGAGFPENTYLGFYNQKTGRWLVDLDGSPRISWGEIITPIENGGQGGAQNVVVAAMTWETRDRTLEIDQAIVPEDPTQLPLLPFRWAMPPFGLAKEVGSRIRVCPLPPSLGKDDCWPLLLSRGHFTKEYSLSPEVQVVLPDGSILDTQKYNHIVAHYNISEADVVQWSKLGGEPHRDIEGERPEVLDDYTIRVKYPPIHAMVLNEFLDLKDPLEVNYADTFSPGFVDASGEPDIWYFGSNGWVQLTWDNIEEYDLHGGILYLKSCSTVPLPILSADSPLEINYISALKQYPFRYNDVQLVDLNPMYGHKCNLDGELVDTMNYINKPLYVYLLPALLSNVETVLEAADVTYTGRVLSGRLETIKNSFRKNTIYISTTRDIFDPESGLHDPLAVLIGTIYISPKIAVKDLAILDARRRGGGFARRLTLNECREIYEDIDACWDLGYLMGESYPKNANLTIRIPGWVQHFFTPAEVNSTIEKIVPAGILWRVEYVYGGE